MKPVVLPPLRLRLSVRTRLTLWNVCVLAFVLIASGGVLRSLNRMYLLSGVDHELLRRARRLSAGPLGQLPRPSRFSRPWRSEPRPRTSVPLEMSRFQPLSPEDTSLSRIIDRKGRTVRPVPGWQTWDPAAIFPALAGEIVYSTVKRGGERIRIVSLPLPPEGGRLEPAGVIQVPFRMTDMERGLEALDRTLMILIPVALLVAGAGGALLTDRALGPVRAITYATDRIAAENLSGRLPVAGSDEFSELAHRFNDMLARLEAAFQRQQRFTADASHELRTPLAIIKTNASMALDDEEPTLESYRQALTAIDAAADRTSLLIQDLLLLAQSDAGASASGRIGAHNALALVRAAAEQVEQALRASAAPGRPLPQIVAPTPADVVGEGLLLVFGNADLLVRAFANLIENAVRHTPPSGRVLLAVEREAGRIEVKVSDTGEGIPETHLPHLFERFYRVDASRARRDGGTGLGLAIVKSIVEAHRGTIAVESLAGWGTTILISLPAQTSAVPLVTGEKEMAAGNPLRGAAKNTSPRPHPI